MGQQWQVATAVLIGSEEGGLRQAAAITASGRDCRQEAGVTASPSGSEKRRSFLLAILTAKSSTASEMH